MVCLLAALLALMMSTTTLAQNIESALMPGKVIEGHAKHEDDCGKCHVRFNKNAQSGLCMQCHKSVATDVQTNRGYHGRIKSHPCSACHIWRSRSAVQMRGVSMPRASS